MVKLSCQKTINHALGNCELAQRVSQLPINPCILLHFRLVLMSNYTSENGLTILMTERRDIVVAVAEIRA